MKIVFRDRALTDRPAAVCAEPCLNLTGRFDAFETANFRSAIEQLIENGASTIWIDLSAISFVDSSALAELVRAHKRCRDLNGELVIVSPSDPVTVIFELTRLDAAFRIERNGQAIEVA